MLKINIPFSDCKYWLKWDILRDANDSLKLKQLGIGMTTNSASESELLKLTTLPSSSSSYSGK